MHCQRHTSSNAQARRLKIFFERARNHSATSKVSRCPLSLHSGVFAIFTPSASICTNYAIYYNIFLRSTPPPPSIGWHPICWLPLVATIDAFVASECALHERCIYSVCIAAKQKHTSRPMNRRAQPWLWSSCTTAEWQRFFRAIASTRPNSRFAQMPNSGLNSSNGAVFLSFSHRYNMSVGGCCLIFTPHTSALRFCTASL